MSNDRQWKVEPEKKNEVTFDEYSDDIGHIYSATDADRRVPDLVLNVIRHASKVSEAVRRGESARILEELCDVTLWLLSLIAKMKKEKTEDDPDRLFDLPLTVTDIIWNKYPGTCPVCLERQIEREFPDILDEAKDFSQEQLKNLGQQLAASVASGEADACNCLASSGVEERNPTDEIKHRKQTVRRAYAAALTDKKRTKLFEIEAMFNEIYDINVQNMHLDDITFHLQEEVGELAESILDTYTYDLRKLRKRFGQRFQPGRALLDERIEDLAEEMADVFSWIYALIFKIRMTMAHARDWWEKVMPGVRHSIDPARITLAAVIWYKYGDEKIRKHLICGDCANDECKCEYIIVRTKEDVDRLRQRP